MKFSWNGEKETPFMVGICGRSCSGKGVVDDIASAHYKVLHINADMFFADSTSCRCEGYDCWEHADCIRWDHLVETLTKLKSGRGAIIQDRSLWSGSYYDVEIVPDDLHKRSLILVEGFLLFTAEVTKEVLELLDDRIYIDVSDLNILYRRLRREQNMNNINYIYHVVIPVSKEYEFEQIANAYRTIDGNLTLKEVRGHLTNFLGLPTKQSVWKVSFGDLITDHAWHPIDLSNLKGWVRTQDNLNALEQGHELFGNAFRYRKNRNYGTYEVRLEEKLHLYRYDPQPI